MKVVCDVPPGENQGMRDKIQANPKKEENSQISAR
jgi:hypothetical protein